MGGNQKGNKIKKSYLLLSITLCALTFAAIFNAEDATAEEGACFLKASNKAVFLIVYDIDRDGNQGAQIWQGRLNQGESVKITTPHGRFRYDYNDQPDQDQPLSGGADRWCNNLNTVLVP
jgi:hypothetical protein